jgi:hypothetical protein
LIIYFYPKLLSDTSEQQPGDKQGEQDVEGLRCQE